MNPTRNSTAYLKLVFFKFYQPCGFGASTLMASYSISCEMSSERVVAVLIVWLVCSGGSTGLHYSELWSEADIIYEYESLFG